MNDQYGNEIANVKIRVDLLKEIQHLSVNTQEIYEDQTPEDFVNNILVTEKQRLLNQRIDQRIDMSLKELKDLEEEIKDTIADEEENNISLVKLKELTNYLINVKNAINVLED